MTGTFTPVHPLFFVSYSDRGERRRKAFIMKLQRAADKVMHRILLETARWMLAKPEDMLLALAEADRRLQAYAVDDVCYAPTAFAVEHIFNEALLKVAEAERDGLITITLIGSKTDATRI